MDTNKRETLVVDVDDYTQVEDIAGYAAVDQLSLQAMLYQRPHDNNC